MSRRWLIPSIVPAFALTLAACGECKEKAAVFAFVFGAVLVVWAFGLVVALAVQVARRGWFAPLLVALGLSAVSAVAIAELALGTPLWVRWRAAPAIAALEDARTENGHYPKVGSLEGDFPRPLRAVLEASGHCIYKPRGASYHLACLSVPYSKCGYDGATHEWSGWE